MKKYKYLLIALLFITGILGCEKWEFGDDILEQPPTISTTIDTVFQYVEYAEQFLWSAYATLPYGLAGDVELDNQCQLRLDPIDALTDICYSSMSWGGCQSLYYNGQYSAASDTPGAPWTEQRSVKYNFLNSGAWDGIRKAYIFLENSNRILDATSSHIDQLNAEAKMIIAMHYTEMFRHYGGLPWVSKSFQPSDEIFLPRLEARATVDSILVKIDEAIPYLPWQIADIANWDGRFTQASAMGLKSRLLLFAASPLFNSNSPAFTEGGQAVDEKLVWFGSEDMSLWQDAADASIDLINMVESQGGYSLYSENPFNGTTKADSIDKYRQDFQDATIKRGSPETLISTRVDHIGVTIHAWNNWQRYALYAATTFGTSGPTQELVDMFGMDNGLALDDPNSGWDPSPETMYLNRDPRLYETVVVNGDRYNSRTAELWTGGLDGPDQTGAGLTGYHMRKFVLDRNAATSINSIVHYPHLRLAEIYLNAAEALNEANFGPTAEAYEYVEKVRARVGLPGFPDGMTQEEFREELLNERVREFAYENTRWYDIIRWKREDLLTKPRHQIVLTNTDGELSYEIEQIPLVSWQMGGWSSKWYLSAFPADEINKDYGLVQNPGW
jgi:hypothetical protein